jgi:hypothetical protein
MQSYGMYLKAPNVKSHGFYFPTSRECMGHFLEQVSIQKLGAQPRTQYFQGSSRQQLEKCLIYSIFYAFHLGTSLGKGAFSPNWYQDETHRILHKVQHGSLSSPWHLPPRLLRHQESFSSPPGRCSFSWITTLCTLQKDPSFLLPNSPRKVHFRNARLARRVLLAVSFSLQMSTTMAICAYGNDCFLC